MNDKRQDRKPIPIVTGLAAFDKVVQGEAFYVDKTLFVKDVFDSGSESTLILRPRRWGKSLNLAMLKYFLEAPLREGAEKPGEIDLGKLEEKKNFFKTKKILLEHPEMEEHLGRYTVLSLSLAGFEVKSEQDLLEFMNEEVGRLFRSFVVLTPVLLSSEQEKFQTLCAGKASLTELSKSVYFLSPILARVYQRPLFLLLDEYDAGVNTVLEKALKKTPGAEELLTSVVGFFGAFYESSVKLNTHVYRTVFTGVFRVLKGTVGTSMNNFSEHYLLSKEFARDFGFTEEELKRTLGELQVPQEDHAATLQTAKKWYNGYQSQVGPIYNPWSLMHWLRTGKATSYWVNMGSLDVILAVSEYAQNTEELKRLVMGETIQVSVLWAMTLRHVRPESSLATRAFWTLLAFSGYVSMEKEWESSGVDLLCDLRIPNKELMTYFKACLLDDFSMKYGLDKTALHVFAEALLRGDIETFERNLSTFLMRIASAHDVSDKKIEAFYQGFLLGLVVEYHEKYHIRSDFPTGRGRGDLLLIPKTKEQGALGVVLEYKVAYSKKALPKEALVALGQIAKTAYLAEMENFAHVKESLSIGLSFYKKDFCLKVKKGSPRRRR